jgi:hypothetical protein
MMVRRRVSSAVSRRPRKVVQADVDVTSPGEHLVGHRSHREFLPGTGQRRPVVEDFLRGLDPGHVRVAENRKPVGLEFEHIAEGAGERLGRLQRQPVDQVHVDRPEPGGAQPAERLLVLPLRLDAMDGELDPRIGILHAQGSPAGADVAQRVHVRRGQAAGIDLHAEFAPRRDVENLPNQRPEPAQLLRRKEGGRATPEMDLGDGSISIHPGGRQAHLPRQVVQVLPGGIPATGDHRVATAEPAKALTEWQVKIEGDRAGARLVVRPDRVLQLEGGQIGGELRRRGLGGVAGAGNRVFPDKLEIEDCGG